MFNGKLIGVALLALLAGLVQAEEDHRWASLSTQEHEALAPLASNWDKLTPSQQTKLLGVARGFPKLTPHQQRLLQARLRSWSQMTTEQRQIARDNYRKIQALPKQDQSTIRQQWLDSLCQEFGHSDSGARQKK